jgi:membrane protein
MRVCKLQAIAFVIILLIFSESIISFLSYQDSIKAVQFIGVLSIAVLVSLVRIDSKLFQQGSVFRLFLAFFFLFNFGQVILLSLDNKEVYSQITSYGRFSYTAIFRASCYALRTLIFIEFGRLLAFRDTQANYLVFKTEDEACEYSLRKIGFWLCIIAIPLDLINTFSVVSHALIYGYKATYGNDYLKLGSSLSSIALYYLTGIYLLALANKANKKKTLLILSYIVIRSSALFLIGKRGAAVPMFIALLWFYFSVFGKGKINVKRIILLIIIGYIGLAASLAVFDMRNNPNMGFGDLVQNISNSIVKFEVFSSSLMEFGGSLRPLLEVMRFAENGQMDCVNGLSYVFSLFGIIPSGLRGPITDIGAQFNAIDVGVMLEKKVGLSYGIGYSLVAESYYNFGTYGFLTFIPFGFLLSKLFQPRERNTSIANESQIAFISILFSLTLMSVRGTSELLFKNIFYYYIIPMYLLRSIYESVKERS